MPPSPQAFALFALVIVMILAIMIFVVFARTKKTGAPPKFNLTRKRNIKKTNLKPK